MERFKTCRQETGPGQRAKRNGRRAVSSDGGNRQGRERDGRVCACWTWRWRDWDKVVRARHTDSSHTGLHR